MMQKDISDALHVDELGIETAVFAELRLKSAYRPVFRRSAELLEMIAGDAVTIILREGIEGAHPDLPMLGQSSEPQLLFDLRQALHIANYRNLDASDCDLIVEHDLSRNRQLFQSVADAARHAAAVGFNAAEPHRIICDLRRYAAMPWPDLTNAAAELREAGFRIALHLFDGADGMAHLTPDIVQVSSPWTAKIAREPSATALLRQLTDRHRAAGTRIMVGGIAALEELELALGIGADYLAGDLLAPPLLAGVAIDPRPLSIALLRQRFRVRSTNDLSPDDAAILRFSRIPRR